MIDMSKPNDAPKIAGMRVRYAFFQMKTPLSSLAGVQTKFGATLHEGTGVVLEVRHHGPDAEGTPAKVTLLVKPDGGGPDLEVPARAAHPLSEA